MLVEAGGTAIPGGYAATRIAVHDTGIGIPPEHITWIFELFNQMKNGPERAREGIGVGLALARKLVELHGGTIEAKSEGLGKGSEFIVRLPLELPKNCGTKSSRRSPAQGHPPNKMDGFRMLRRSK